MSDRGRLLNGAALYDMVMSPADRAGLRRLRRRVVGGAVGRTLELGAGTGLNLPLYSSGVEMIGMDPHFDALKRARQRASSSRAGTAFVQSIAEALPFLDNSFDAVVATLVLCTVGDPDRTLQEVRRVLRPGGELRLLEHVRFPHSGVARLQDLIDPAWTALLAGCHVNRDTLASVMRAGMQVQFVRQHLGGLVLEINALT